MSTMNATDARNNIGKLWEAAAQEPVTIESAGKPIAVVLSPEAYRKLIGQRKPRQAGTLRHLFAGVDVDALLATPIEDVFAEYMQLKYLLDSHTFLWFGTDDHQLPAHIRSIIEEPENGIGISIASFWEIAIKHSLGKLPLKMNMLGLETAAKDLSIEVVPITIQAIHQITLMPHHHKDPFDRIIAATALTTSQIVLSADAIFDAYGVARMWQER